MTITISQEAEKSILAAVQGGRFASVDEAVAEAVRLLGRGLNRKEPPTNPTEAGTETPDLLLGLMRDDAELMDVIVADAYRQRREGRFSLAMRSWRLFFTSTLRSAVRKTTSIRR